MALTKVQKEEIRRLEWQTQEALKLLSPKQRKLALGIAEGKTIAEAGREAGYSSRATTYQAAKLTKVDVAIFLVDRLYQLQHGVSVAKKREMLLDIADTAKTPGASYSPSAAVSALRLLAEIDQDIKGDKVSGNVTITVDTGIRRNTTVEGEVVDVDSGE